MDKNICSGDAALLKAHWSSKVWQSIATNKSCWNFMNYWLWKGNGKQCSNLEQIKNNRLKIMYMDVRLAALNLLTIKKPCPINYNKFTDIQCGHLKQYFQNNDKIHQFCRWCQYPLIYKNCCTRNHQ